jgi:mRNA interferase YafQ
MLTLEYTNQFKKDLKLSKKRGKDPTKLQGIIELLLQEKPLLEKHRDHSLSGNYKDHRECHIEPDWLLIYLIKNEVTLVLVRIGSHADLF